MARLEIDPAEYAERLINTGTARTVLDDQIDEALLRLADKRAIAHGQVIASDAGNLAQTLVTLYGDTMADWDRLTHPQRNRVRVALQGMIEERMAEGAADPDSDDDEADGVYDMPGDDRVQHRLTGYYDGQRIRSPAPARRVYPDPALSPWLAVRALDWLISSTPIHHCGDVSPISRMHFPRSC
jgi:hypothetical protein